MRGTAPASLAGLAVACAVVVACSASSPNPAPGSGRTPSPRQQGGTSAPACLAQDLRLRVLGNTYNGGAGQNYVRWRVTNVGGAACTVRGYPQVTLADDRGRDLHASVARTHDWRALGLGRIGVATVALPAGGWTIVGFAWFGHLNCANPTVLEELHVAFTNSRGLLALPERACGGQPKPFTYAVSPATAAGA